jgi:hypothetical protein
MRHATLRVLPLLLCAAQAMFGCSLTPMELRQVSSDLTVVVTHRGKPIAGIEVQVVPEKSTEPVFSGATDAHGTVLMKGLMVGRYHLTASHEDFDAGKEWIEVVSVPNAKTKRRFDFQWADWSYQTREVAGTLTGLIPGNTGKPLMDIVHPRETVFPGVDITLKNAFSSDEYRTVSDSTGAFLMAEVPDGVYILTIAGGMKSLTGIVDATRQVLDVTHTATIAALPLRLKDTGCYRTEFQLSDCMMEGTIYQDGVPIRFCTKG